MSVALPPILVDEPIRHESLQVFPLIADTEGDVEYLLSDVALEEESLTVEEIGEAGTVRELVVNNKGDQRVLFLEGEELVGAKQNRILNTSVLVAARTRTRIPVSCVEKGRWRYTSRRFKSSGSHGPVTLRHTLKSSVKKSLDAMHGHQSNQNQVWECVQNFHRSHSVASRSAAMSDAFVKYQSRITEYLEALPYVEGASGVAVAIGGRVLAMDVFDKPETCQQVWKRLLSGFVFDALEAAESAQTATVPDVEELLASTNDLPWKQSIAAGEGEEYRAESAQGDQASALHFQKTVLHGSVVAAA